MLRIFGYVFWAMVFGFAGCAITAHCSPVWSNEVVIRFTDNEGTIIANREGFLEIDAFEVSTLVPVGEPDSYVELSSNDSALAGAWCDHNGYAAFLVYEPLPDSTELRITQKPEQALAVHPGSVHRLKPLGQPVANPGLVACDEVVWLAYEDGTDVSCEKWSLLAGTRLLEAFTSQAEQFASPRPVADATGAQMKVFADKVRGVQHQVYRLTSDLQQAASVSNTENTPREIAALSCDSGYLVFYSEFGGITKHSAPHAGSATTLSRYCKDPLECLTASSGPDNADWFAGRADGKIRVYVSSNKRAEISGDNPALCRATIDRQSHMYLLYLSEECDERGLSDLNMQRLTQYGYTAGAPLLGMKMPTVAHRLACVGFGQERILLFWEQTFKNEPHVFFTTVSVSI